MYIGGALLAGLALYVLVGLALLAAGPLRRKVSEAAADARGLNLLNAYYGRPALSKSRLLLFGTLLSLGVILLWPIFLPGAVREELRTRRSSTDGEDARRSEVFFQFIGGAGTISCLECGYSAEIVSFVHGETSTTGYQCESCGTFIALANSSPDVVAGGCKCGGTLTRSRALFCPRCRGKKLQYDMEYIT